VRIQSIAGLLILLKVKKGILEKRAKETLIGRSRSQNKEFTKVARNNFSERGEGKETILHTIQRKIKFCLLLFNLESFTKFNKQINK